MGKHKKKTAIGSHSQTVEINCVIYKVKHNIKKKNSYRYTKTRSTVSFYCFRFSFGTCMHFTYCDMSSWIVIFVCCFEMVNAVSNNFETVS